MPRLARILHPNLSRCWRRVFKVLDIKAFCEDRLRVGDRAEMGTLWYS